MTHVEPKRIPCALVPKDYMLAGPRGGDRDFMLISNRASSRMVTIALDRPAAKALKKQLKAFLKGDL